MAPTHRYTTRLRWTGDRGSGTSDYKAYGRDHVIEVASKPPILGSSDPAFRGDPGRHNPEELVVAALSACHMLSYLHLCAEAGVVVRAYEDDAEGTLEMGRDGGGHFTDVTLRPRVTISRGEPARALALHHGAHERCFIASSVNFPVRVEPAEVRGP